MSKKSLCLCFLDHLSVDFSGNRYCDQYDMGWEGVEIGRGVATRTVVLGSIPFLSNMVFNPVERVLCHHLFYSRARRNPRVTNGIVWLSVRHDSSYLGRFSNVESLEVLCAIRTCQNVGRIHSNCLCYFIVLYKTQDAVDSSNNRNNVAN